MRKSSMGMASLLAALVLGGCPVKAGTHLICERISATAGTTVSRSTVDDPEDIKINGDGTATVKKATDVKKEDVNVPAGGSITTYRAEGEGEAKRG
jgi:hypothetical protein